MTMNRTILASAIPLTDARGDNKKGHPYTP
jgi:hypothetical protein